MKKSVLKKLIKEEIKTVLSERKASSVQMEPIKRIIEEYTDKKIIVVHAEKGSRKGRPGRLGSDDLYMPGNTMKPFPAVKGDEVIIYVTPRSSFYKSGKKPKTIPQHLGIRPNTPDAILVYDDYEYIPDYSEPEIDFPGLCVVLSIVGNFDITLAQKSSIMIGNQYIVIEDVEKLPRTKKYLEDAGPDRVYYKGGPNGMWWLRTWE